MISFYSTFIVGTYSGMYVAYQIPVKWVVFDGNIIKKINFSEAKSKKLI